MNISRKIIQYSKTVGLSALMGLSSCTKDAPSVNVEQVIKEAPSKTISLIALLERGDRHAVKLAKAPENKRVIHLDEIKNYLPNDSVGELFYQVYVGKADKAIRKATNKKGDLVTVGQGVTGYQKIKLAGGISAKEGDYISAHSVDSLTNLAINEKINIIQSAIGDSVYNNLKPNEKDAVIAYLYNVQPEILLTSSTGKSFFEYLAEGNMGMVQSKFNVKPSSKVAEVGLAKRNLVQMLIFGDGKVYPNKESVNNFKKQMNIVKKHKKGQEFLAEVIDIVEKYGVNSDNLAKTKNMMFPAK